MVCTEAAKNASYQSIRGTNRHSESEGLTKLIQNYIKLVGTHLVQISLYIAKQAITVGT